MKKKQARSEKSGGQGSSSKSGYGKKPIRRKRGSIHENFAWGFVAGEEDEFYSGSDKSSSDLPDYEKFLSEREWKEEKGPDSQSSPRENSQGKTGNEKKSTGKKAEKDSSRDTRKRSTSSGASPRSENEKRPKSVPTPQKKSHPAFLFEDEWDDDDLSLPSYGRTDLFRKSENSSDSPSPAPSFAPPKEQKVGERPISREPDPVKDRKKVPESRNAKKAIVADSERKTSKSVPESFTKKSDQGTKKSGEKKSQPAPSDKSRNENVKSVKFPVSREKKSPEKPLPTELPPIPALPKKERQRWDPRKREYIADHSGQSAAPGTEKVRKEATTERDRFDKKTGKTVPEIRESASVSDPSLSLGPDKKRKKLQRRPESDDFPPFPSGSGDDHLVESVSENQPLKSSRGFSERKTQKDTQKSEKGAGKAKKQSDKKVAEEKPEIPKKPTVSPQKTPQKPSPDRGEPENREKKDPNARKKGEMSRSQALPVPAKKHLSDAETPVSGFGNLSLSETMLESLEVAQYLEPTPIQAGVIPSVMKGIDVLGQAQTGTGKTAAFLIPILEGIEECEPGELPVAMILVPTRELAVQVRDEAVKLAYGRDIRIIAAYGGKPIAKQIVRLREGVDVIIGTPGRIKDLMGRKVLSFAQLRWIVLDEADRMLDIGFRPDIEKILAKTPSSRQTLLFSATLPPQVVKLAKKYMIDPEVLDFSSSNVAVDTIEQFYITVDQLRKFDALVCLLKQENPKQAIIFCRTKRGADRLGRMLESQFSGLSTIHGDLQQSQRDRVMSQFRGGKVQILVATDVVGRGIDVSGISHIINYDIPSFCDDYVHRVGRTGRMGREGVAYTFVTAEEGSELTRIEMRINRLLERVELKGFEAFAKPTDSTITDPFGPSQAKPIFGKPIRKIRRAL